MGYFCLRLYFNFFLQLELLCFFVTWILSILERVTKVLCGYLISAGNLFQIRRLQFPFHCCHQTTTGIGENVAKNLNRILSISQIAFLARRNLNWKRTFIYISNKRNATPAQYINTTVVPTGLTSKNFFSNERSFYLFSGFSPFPSLEGGRW